MNALLQNDLICDYVGLKSHHQPTCHERGDLKDIQDDSFYSNCQINQTRNGGFWINARDEILIDNADEWKKVHVRECFRSAHGGKNNCIGESEKVLRRVDMNRA